MALSFTKVYRKKRFTKFKFANLFSYNSIFNFGLSLILFHKQLHVNSAAYTNATALTYSRKLVKRHSFFNIFKVESFFFYSALCKGLVILDFRKYSNFLKQHDVLYTNHFFMVYGCKAPFRFLSNQLFDLTLSAPSIILLNKLKVLKQLRVYFTLKTLKI